MQTNASADVGDGTILGNVISAAGITMQYHGIWLNGEATGKPVRVAVIGNVIAEAHKAGAKVGLCGQAPSDHPEFARFLVQCGIDSISVSPDSFVAVKEQVAQAEKAQRPAA